VALGGGLDLGGERHRAPAPAPPSGAAAPIGAAPAAAAGPVVAPASAAWKVWPDGCAGAAAVELAQQALDLLDPGGGVGGGDAHAALRRTCALSAISSRNAPSARAREADALGAALL
jgi:hypothetical protein